jgi:nucleoside-triphosphatase THEP1
MKAGGYIDEVKHRPDVRLYELTEKNRDRLASDIGDAVRRLLTSP